MTIYDLTQALWRYRRAVLISLGSLLLLVLVMSFTVRDGSVAWRSGEKWQASVQMAVISRGTDSLAVADPNSSRLAEAATLYAGLLTSDQAAAAIGDTAGFALSDPVEAAVTRNSSLITATVLGPTAEQTQIAALATFDYLESEISSSLTTTDMPVTPTTAPSILLDQPFNSFLTIDLDQNLDNLPEDLFIEIDTELGGTLVLPVSRSAGDSTSMRTTLAPIMSIIVRLQYARGEVLDTLRIAPTHLSGSATVLPALMVKLDSNSIIASQDDEGTITWQLNPDRIRTLWVNGESIASEGSPTDLETDIALLTLAPVAQPIGGRRGPIVAFAVLFVGTVLIVTGVIVFETWQSEREISESGTKSDPVAKQATKPSSTKRTTKQAPRSTTTKRTTKPAATKETATKQAPRSTTTKRTTKPAATKEAATKRTTDLNTTKQPAKKEPDIEIPVQPKPTVTKPPNA